jgi:hypothetical protein
VAVPRLNKNDHISQYLTQLETREYDLSWARVTETVSLNCKEWNEFVTGLLTDREWLAGKGGTCSWSFADDEDLEFFKLTEEQQTQWKRTAFMLVIAVIAPSGQTIYVDPQGYNYARYLAFPAAELPEGKTREELRREREKAEQLERVEKLKQRIATPPEVPADHGLRFLWNGIKYNGLPDLFSASYSMGTLHHYPEGTITVYARDYKRFPVGIARYFHIENETEYQSDYFDDDKFRVCANHALYALVKAAFDAQESHHERRMAKRAAKYA